MRNDYIHITFVIDKCLRDSGIEMDMIDAVAVTYGPGLIGSLLVGLEAAKTIAYVYDKPFPQVHDLYPSKQRVYIFHKQYILAKQVSAKPR